VEFTLYEALARIAHRVAVSEEERKGMEAVFLSAHGSDDEKKRLYTESEADKATRLEKEKFDAAVEAAVKERQNARTHDAAVAAAADAKVQADTAAIVAPTTPAPVAP
jgi:hypothetical protein